MARPGQRRNNSDDGTLRPIRFAQDLTGDTGCFKNNLSLAQINSMTDQDLLAFLSTKKDQSRDGQTLFAIKPAGSLDGNGDQNIAIAGAMQEEDAKDYKPPDSAEICRQSSVQRMINGPHRPCTPPAQSNSYTGISLEEVNAFISGPNEDQKWTCMYPDCGKKFGRKENIKSHVQTHLGDRQFLCVHCNKRFVRQHDLKRHEKIHTGVKPYPCECGHSFARMDALTRHKQRNTCVGGIGGPAAVDKKDIKRGRPRKHRPDTEERLDKASRTRQRVLEKKAASSVSGSSVCSFSSPPAMPDGYETDASAAFPTTPQMMLSYDTDASVAMSRETSSSHYGTPPELDLSSSSPIASRFFDFDELAEIGADHAKGDSDQVSSELASNLVLTQAETDIDQMLLEFTNQAPTLSSGAKDNDMDKSRTCTNSSDFSFLDDDPFNFGQDYPSRLEDFTKLESLSWRMGSHEDS
ncbi:MAG: hypothetical protein Q9195_002861 [Heterodermia aff. obscurata]